jgi:predicted nucleotidyltransferase
MKNKRFENVDEIISVLRRHSQNLQKRFRVKEIGVFGSYVRGEKKRGSDIDILVEFEKGYKTFDNYMELKFYLEEVLMSKIDLVLKTGIREELKQYILAEVHYV